MVTNHRTAVVDVYPYTEEMDSYLQARSILYDKPIKVIEGGGARIFFTVKEDAMMFSLAFGHQIQSSHVNEINNFIAQRE